MQRHAAKMHHVCQTLTMKKSAPTLLTVLMANAMCANAQNPTSRLSLSLAAGPAYPINAFHQTASFSGIAGPSGDARSGGSVEIGASWRFSRYISAAVVAEGQENKGNGIEYSFFTPDTKAPAGSSKGNNWKIARIMAGPVYTLPLSKKTGPTLLVRLLGGVQKTVSPDFKAALSHIFENLSVINIEPTAYTGHSFPWSFSYEADAGLEWKFGRQVAALGWVGYQGSRVSTYLPYMAYGYVLNAAPAKVTFNMATIALRAGVSYNLSR
jgi:hypothetical protein